MDICTKLSFENSIYLLSEISGLHKYIQECKYLETQKLYQLSLQLEHFGGIVLNGKIYKSLTSLCEDKKLGPYFKNKFYIVGQFVCAILLEHIFHINGYTAVANGIRLCARTKPSCFRPLLHLLQDAGFKFTAPLPELKVKLDSEECDDVKQTLIWIVSTSINISMAVGSIDELNKPNNRKIRKLEKREKEHKDAADSKGEEVCKRTTTVGSAIEIENWRRQVAEKNKRWKAEHGLVNELFKIACRLTLEQPQVAKTFLEENWNAIGALRTSDSVETWY